MLPFASNSTPGIFLVPRSRGPTPDKNKRLPTRRACGYKPTGSGALDDVMMFSSYIITFQAPERKLFRLDNLMRSEVHPNLVNHLLVLTETNFSRVFLLL